MTETIPQRTLRNRSGEILRRAEAGERFEITVNGRIVAVIGPFDPRRWVTRGEVRELLATPSDPELLSDLRSRETNGLDDPWQR